MKLRKPTFLNSVWWDRIKRVGALIGKGVLTVGLIGVITGCIVACVLTVYIATNFDGEGSLPDVDLINDNQTTVVMVQNSKGEYEEYQRLAGVQREWVKIADIPANMQNAVVAIEDERFNTHYGVDWKRTISAFANLVLHFNDTEYGGSTLTQQLVKNLTDNDDHTIQRKVTEIFTAIEMEEYYSKDEILQAYLNIIPLTGEIEGVGAGARQYFGKEVGELTLAECAVIASITNNPSKYNPYTHPKALIGRQQTVLFKMHELGFITTDEYQQALGEELHFVQGVNHSKVYDYYTDMLIDEVVEDLMDTYGYTESHAKNMVFYGGLTIYSCENPTLQKKAEAVYADDKNFPAAIPDDEEQPQAAIYVMDYTGKTVAVVGGRGEKTANRVLNRATSSMRQPGSSIKPIAVYAPAVSLNLINFSSPVKNCYIVLANGDKWPRNYGQSRPRDSGMTVVDIAIQQSMNTVPAQLLQTMTPQRSFDYLTNSLKMTSLVRSDGKGNSDIDYAPMGLGGMTKGVIAQEIAAAYQIFGNGGIYNEPYSYTRVERDGEEILTKGSTHVQALDTDSAYIMNRLLQNVVQGNYQATARAIKGSWKNWEVFAKTGTTQENNDVWLVGGTPKYVAASWFGYDKNQELRSTQTSAARNLWNATMKVLHEGEKPMTFTEVGNTVEAKFCYESGLLATSGCKKTGTGVYKPDHLPELCDKHKGDPVNTVGPQLPTAEDENSTSIVVTDPTETETTTTAE